MPFCAFCIGRPAKRRWAYNSDLVILYLATPSALFALMAAHDGRRSQTMTDDGMPDLKADALGSKTDGQELVATTPVESQPDDGPAESPETKARVAVLKLSALRARALTEEEEAENHRRLKEIRAGRHPDTGQRLRPGDRKTLKPREVWELQMQRDTVFGSIEASYRRTIDALERERTINMAIYGTPFSSDFQRAIHD